MPWYLTQYPPIPTQPNSNGETVIGYFGVHLWARHRAEAESFALARNIGEIIIGASTRSAANRPEPLASDLLRKRRMTAAQQLDFIHTITFLGYLCQRSLSTPSHEILGDEGFIHQAIHCLRFGEPRRKDVIALLQHYESRVPGLVARRREGV